MNEEAREQELHRKLREDNTAELAQRWEAPMPDAERAILKEELERRGHRLASLPAPAPHDAPVRREPPPTPAERARRAVRRARGALLFVGVLQLLASAWVAFAAFGATRMAEAVGADTEAPPIDPRLEVAASFASGLVFLALWRTSRDAARPRVALGLGFALYLTITALLFVVDPGGAFRGVVVKAIVLALLALGLRATFSPALREPEPTAAS